MDLAPPNRVYCTLFDVNYLLKGLTLYRSLEKQDPTFFLFILCMDDHSYDLLSSLNLACAGLIRLADFESPELLAVKPDRTTAEYCWTCAPCLPSYLFETHPSIQFVTYLDADLMFFSSLDPIYEEVGPASSVIVEHRFSPRFMPSIINGKYNVQWVSFRRDANGLETLNWWRDRCLEWCYYRLEGERMGDQKYLDCWTEKFKGVHELQHVGAGTAPWNFANYAIREVDGRIFIDDLPLIFYHFHSYRILPDGKYNPMPAIYREGEVLPQVIYDRYASAIQDSLAVVRSIEPDFDRGIEDESARPLSVPTTRFPTTPLEVARATVGRMRRALLLRLRRLG